MYTSVHACMYMILRTKLAHGHPFAAETPMPEEVPLKEEPLSSARKGPALKSSAPSSSGTKTNILEQMS